MRATDPVSRLRAAARVAAVLVASACASPGTSVAPAPSSEARAPAPWRDSALTAGDVPAVYLTVWRQAENRAQCALLAPARLDPQLERAATPRAATFSGGWAVAYDLPETRSAFGVAGTGAKAWRGEIYDEWPHSRILADGSFVGYGPEGGTGPNWLAYVRIPAQECLYNVWSRRGQAHLEELLGQLRFVTVP